MKPKIGLSPVLLALVAIYSAIGEAAPPHGRRAHHRAGVTHQTAKPYGAGLSEEQSLRALESEISRKLGASIRQDDYPEQARREGWAGTTWVDVLVGTDGKIKQVAVQQSSGFEILDEQALRMVDRISLWWIPQRLRHREAKVAVPVGFYVRDEPETPLITADMFVVLLAERVYLPALYCRNASEMDSGVTHTLAVDLVPPLPPEQDATVAGWTVVHVVR